jgi:hypothetical protein
MWERQKLADSPPRRHQRPAPETIAGGPILAADVGHSWKRFIMNT